MQELQGNHSLVCAWESFRHVLLTRVKDRLLPLRRKEQIGFTPGRSTVDRIFAISTLIQTLNEYRRPLCIAYIDLKAAFDVQHSGLYCCRLACHRR